MDLPAALEITVIQKIRQFPHKNAESPPVRSYPRFIDSATLVWQLLAERGESNRYHDYICHWAQSFDRYCGQLSIGHAGFMAVGAYTSAFLTQHFGMPFR